MDELISRAALLHNLNEQAPKPTTDDLYTVNLCIINAPAVDAAPVVHGRWIEYPLCLGYVGAYSDDHIVCSNCKSVWSIIDNETERFDCCPHCGAKMDKN